MVTGGHPFRGGTQAELAASILRDDPEWEVRVHAARALGLSYDEAARPTLESALEDSSEFVRSAAAYALKLLDEGPPPEPVPTLEDEPQATTEVDREDGGVAGESG